MHPGAWAGSRHQAQLEAEPILEPTVVNVWLAFWPRTVMAAMHTTIIRASMTAYSTAVGPSSACTNFTTERVRFCNMAKVSLVQRCGTTRGLWPAPRRPGRHTRATRPTPPGGTPAGSECVHHTIR